MKIALLLCDVPTPELQKDFGLYQDMFTRLINSGDELDTFPICKVEDDQPAVFPALEDYDGFIVSGSKKGVYEGHHWQEPLFAFIRDIAASGKKLVGVCFGHQAIMYALGGEVSKSSKGWGIGHYTNQWNIQGDQMTGAKAGGGLCILSFHQDQVDKLPADFEVLAGCEFTPNYVVKYKDQIFTTQGHPEMSAEYIYALTKHLEPSIGAAVAEQGRKSLQTNDDTPYFRQLIREFWRQ